MERTGNKVGTVAAFAVIYLVWGSTYAAVGVAVATLPPFLMASSRFAVAGAALYAFLRWRGVPRPGPREWKNAALLAALMVVGGGGAVCWAQQTIDSGLSSVLRATVPMWLIALQWRSRGRPRGIEVAGLTAGLVGVWLLAAPAAAAGCLPGVLVLLVSSLSWAVGSLLVIRLATGVSAPMLTAQQMLLGSVMLGALGLITGETGRFELASLTGPAAAAVLYLTLAGTLLAYSCYLWLLGQVGPTTVATHTFVNPVVAVFVGYLVLGEPLSWQSGLGALLVVSAVATIVVPSRPRHDRPNRGNVERLPVSRGRSAA